MKTRRETLAVAKAIIPDIPFGRYQDVEQFNIMLQSSFIDNGDSDLLLQFASAIKIDKGAEIADNGVSQTTTIKSGVSSLAPGKNTEPGNVEAIPHILRSGPTGK